MGTSTQPGGQGCDRIDQPAAAAGGGAGAPSRSSSSSSSSPQLQYWYSRAHRALKQRASEPAQLLREYQHVTALDATIGHGVGVARSRAAAGRNRYGNVLPYDHNRVVLQQQQQQQQQQQAASKELPSSYINASSITFSTPSLPAPCTYIATQGPLPGTTADFWAMVWEQRVPAIVMLTNCAEAGMVKCSQYFPDTPGAVSRVGGYEIQVAQQAPFGPDCILRTLQLSRTGGDSSAAQQTVSHYHFTTWPDHGTPDSSSGIRALCRALAPARASGRPILVHCSAGIGRTGTFCAVDILLQRLDAWAAMRSGNGSSGSSGGGCGSNDGSCGSNGGIHGGSNGGSNDGGSSGPDRAEVEDTLDVPALVHKLRAQRMGMVQTLEQYVFVYKALIDDLAARLKGGNSSYSNSSSSGRAVP